MKFFTFFSVCLLASHAVFASTTPRKNCLLDNDNVETCTNAPTLLPTTMRQGGGPCDKNDMKCWCLKAKDYTNDVRRRHGRSEMLKVGPMAMLDNAVRYADTLGDMGFLQHQDLGEAGRDVGCGRFIGGENIAYNYESGDVAKACVDQWEGSSGHLENILRESFEEVVVGVHFEPDGRVYCVQTFASKGGDSSNGSSNGSECKPVTMGSGPKPTKKPTPTKKPAPTKRPMPTRKPRKPKMNMMMKDEANRSCRCIELGRKCWYSLRRLSGNRCKAFTSSMKQPKRCKRACCKYCMAYPNTPPCRSRSVMAVCKHLKM